MDAKLQELIGHGIFRGIEAANEYFELAPLRKRERELQTEVSELRARAARIDAHARFEQVATLPASLMLRSRGELCDRLRPYCWRDPERESLVAALRVETELLVHVIATGERDHVTVDMGRLRRLLLLHGMPAWVCAHPHRRSLVPSDEDLDLAGRLIQFGLVDFVIIGKRESWSMSRGRTYQRSR